MARDQGETVQRTGRIAWYAAVSAALAALLAAVVGVDASPNAGVTTNTPGHPRAPSAPAPRRSSASGIRLVPGVHTTGVWRSSEPPTTQACTSTFGVSCYSPVQIETAYDETPLFRSGLTGRGETIAIVDPFGAPDIRQDLAVFDQTYGLATPPSFTILPEGDVPAYSPSTRTMTNWAEETTLDVEYAHTTAPGANLLLVETATSETVGVAGFPTVVAAETTVVDQHLASVISQSFGAGEQTFTSPRTLLGLRSAYVDAHEKGVTVVSASGDTGATESKTATRHAYFGFRVVDWPASDPLVTAVGGTKLILGPDGQRLSPDTAWNDTALLGTPDASGGGTSDVFTRPSYQSSVARVVGGRRGVPDVSMSAAVSGSVLVYLTGVAGGTGWLLVGGTSEAAPLFAGVVAIADQLHTHEPLGLLNPYLYEMAADHDPGIVPVTTGNNTVSFTAGPKAGSVTVTGFSARPGYSLVTGVGTVDATPFVHDLVQTADVYEATHTQSAPLVTYRDSETFLRRS